MTTLTNPLQHIFGKDHDRITNLCFADDIDDLAGEEELAKLVEYLDIACTAYGRSVPRRPI